MQLYKIHTYYVVANSLEQAKEAVKDDLPASYFSESVCPVDVVAVEQSRVLDLPIVCDNCLTRRKSGEKCESCGSYNTANQ